MMYRAVALRVLAENPDSYLHVTSEFPMTVSGKVQKYLMREQSVEMLGLQQAAGIVTA